MPWPLCICPALPCLECTLQVFCHLFLGLASTHVTSMFIDEHLLKTLSWQISVYVFRKHPSCAHAPGLGSAPGHQAAAALPLPSCAACRAALPPYTYSHSRQPRYAQTDASIILHSLAWTKLNTVQSLQFHLWKQKPKSTDSVWHPCLSWSAI